jgi:hypothetical protein
LLAAFLAGFFLGRFLLGGFLLRLAAGLGRNQLDGLLHGDVFRLHLVGQRGVDLAILHIRPVATVHHQHVAIAIRVRPEILERALLTPSATAGYLFGDQVNRTVEANRENSSKSGRLA